MTPWYRRPAYLFSKRIYVRLGAECISALNVDDGECYSDSPIVALRSEGGERTVAGFGDEASANAGAFIEPVNPFDHPRVFVGDMDVAIALVRNAVAAVTGRRPIWRPIIVMHPEHSLPDGLSDIEKRAILDLAFAAGAMGVHLHEGDELEPSAVADFPLARLIPLATQER